MGNKNSKPYQFSENEIYDLTRKFNKLDIDNDGQISVEDFLKVPNMHDSILLKRLISAFDRNQEGKINLKEFIQGISIFAFVPSKSNHHENNQNSKILEKRTRFLFDIYDVNGDGHIDRQELFSVVKGMAGDGIDDEDLQQVVDKTILYNDKTGNGMIDYDEFRVLLAEKNLEKIGMRMNIDPNQYLDSKIEEGRRPSQSKSGFSPIDPEELNQINHEMEDVDWSKFVKHNDGHRGAGQHHNQFDHEIMIDVDKKGDDEVTFNFSVYND